MNQIQVTALAQLITSKTLKPMTPPDGSLYYQPNYWSAPVRVSTAYYVDEDTAAKLAAAIPGATVIKLPPADIWLGFSAGTANGVNMPLANYIQMGPNGIVCARDLSDLASRSFSIYGLSTQEQMVEQELFGLIPGAVVSDVVAAWQNSPAGQQIMSYFLPWGPPVPILYGQ